jgi:hypothetical protein
MTSRRGKKVSARHRHRVETTVECVHTYFYLLLRLACLLALVAVFICFALDAPANEFRSVTTAD